MTVQPTQEELMAYADGELAPEHMKRIEAALASRADLRAVVEDHRRTRAAALQAFDEMAKAPMSPELARVAASLSAPQARSAGRTILKPMLAWPAAAAACLVMGVFAGSLATASNDLIDWRDGPSAGVRLARVLERSPTGEASGDKGRQAIVVASFKSGDGRFCRQFELGQGATDGVACRSDKGWGIIALAQRPGGPGGYQAAGGASPVAQAVTGLEPGPRIEGEAERALIAGKWRD
jgi:hypothetical protein